MKKIRSTIFLLALAVPAIAETYRYVVADYSYSELGGVRSLNVRLHNNGNKNAECIVTVFNRSESAFVPVSGDARVSFSSLPDGAQPRYSCTAN